MKARLDILPAPQRLLWPEFAQIPGHFVLYGGTAIALRLGGRQSLDFDFFTSRPITSAWLAESLPVLGGAEMIQSAPNTASFGVQRRGQIKLSFFGGLSFGRVGHPERCEDNDLQIASLLDLAAQKMKVILVRAEAKDYLDIGTFLRAGLTLAEALGAAKAIHPEFNPILSLKALSYYGEPTLAAVPVNLREFLMDQAAKVGSIKSFSISSADLSGADADEPGR